ncbi:metallophosphoesterase [Bacillus sp. AK031]
MKLIIVSDSHGSKAEIASIYEKHQGIADGFIHCGDSELESSDPAMSGYLAVRGNCDMDSSYPEVLTEQFEDIKIMATHGHLFNVKMSLMNLHYKAREASADMVFFGHSHQLGAEMIDDVLFVNPGSILLPRGRSERTYAFIEAIGKSITVKFLDHNHKEVVDLRREFFV